MKLKISLLLMLSWLTWEFLCPVAYQSVAFGIQGSQDPSSETPVKLVFGETAGVPGVKSEHTEFFEKKIRPVLANNCFKCHGEEKQESRLRLDHLAGILKGGNKGPAIVTGNPDESRLLKAIRYQDPDLQMPPGYKLKDQEIADLTEWVKRGAPWPEHVKSKPEVTGKKEFDLEERAEHWAFQPLKQQALPPVKNVDWPQSPIDYFILAKLEAQGLFPAKPTDKRTLLRRVTYDLIGLPPTPAEIEVFLADDSPQAYHKVVERLLGSSHYGERWGRHWLDLMRFAETDGHEFDQDKPNAHRYRNYVIRAFNEDIPYNQFAVEHLAGDLLEKKRLNLANSHLESPLGTGFYHLGEVLSRPVDSVRAKADRIDNQIDVIGKAFLGLTISCARCHDHKFDPVSTEDYYALAGFLHSSRVRQAAIDSPDRLKKNEAILKDLERTKHVIAAGIAKSAFTRIKDYLLAV
ncbi:DUF1549 domain-containing protein, partial [Acidobacteria bacterium AH-259-O06]|nr:DUF1549 domain-containing protein [Acidobacteria bacterium AH-259-O06]